MTYTPDVSTAAAVPYGLYRPQAGPIIEDDLAITYDELATSPKAYETWVRGVVGDADPARNGLYVCVAVDTVSGISTWERLLTVEQLALLLPTLSAGASGGAFLFGNGAPAPALGKRGDVYIDKSDWTLYQKTPTGWASQGIIKGEDGQDGKNGKDGVGSRIYAGAGAPGINQGTKYDFYIRYNGQLYEKNVGGIWETRGQLQFPASSSGDTSGRVLFFYGESHPDQNPELPADLPDGAVYVDQTDGDLYTLQNGTWTFVLALPGKQGEPGAPGLPGASVPGAPGKDGKDGVDGRDGNDGLPGLTLQHRFGSGVPRPTLGIDGDTYTDVASLGWNYYQKQTGAWALRGQLKGPAGAAGSRILHVASKPAATDGQVYDTAIDDVSGDVYEKTSATTWTLRGNMKGPPGPPGTGGGGTGGEGGEGAPGPEGPKGDDGLSAYDLAVAGGFEGTEEEWLESLHGEQGPPGPKIIPTAEFWKFNQLKAYFVLSVDAIAKKVAGLLRRRQLIESTTTSPDPVKPLPAPNLDYDISVEVPGDDFTLTAAGEALAGSPIIAEHTHSGYAGSVVQLTGENFKNLSAKVYAGGKLYPATVISVADRQTHVQLPANIGQFDVFVLWLKNNVGYGVPVLLNRAYTWVAEDEIVAGQLAHVYGENLAYGNVAGLDNAHVYVQSLVESVFSKAEVTQVYLGRVQYRVPENIPTGPVLVHVHNGHGQEWGVCRPVQANCIDAQEHILYATFDEVRQVALDANPSTENNARKIQDLANTSQNNGRNYSLHLPAGTFPLSDAAFLGSGGCEIVGAVDGQGRPATILRITANFNPNFGAFGSTQPVSFLRIKNVRIENPDGTTLTGSTNGDDNILFNFKHVDHFALLNCEGLTPHGVPLNFQNDCYHVYVRGCRFVGHGSFTGQGRQVFINDNEYRGTENADSLFNTSGLTESDVSDNVVGDNVVNSLDLKDVMVGRFWKAGLNYGSMRYLYIGHNTGELIGPLPQAPDQNQGEIVLIEGAWETFSGYPTTSGGSTVTFEQLLTADYDGSNISQLKLSGNVIPGKHMLRILAGPGMGGCFGIIDHDGHTIELDAPFTVQPTSESLISIGLFHHQVFVEGNFFSGRAGVASRPDYNTQCGVDIYGGGSRWIVVNNRYENLRIGTRIDATYERDKQVLSVHFLTVDNNTYKGNRVDVRLIAGPDGHHDPVWSFPAVGIFGVRLSGNKFSNSILGECQVEVPLTAADLAANATATIQMVSFDGVQGVPVTTIQNYYRADELGSDGVNVRGPRTLVAGALVNFASAGVAGNQVGLVGGTVTINDLGPVEVLPDDADVTGSVLSFSQTFNCILGYLEDDGEFSPMARTYVVPKLDGYSRDEANALFSTVAAHDQLQDVVDDQGSTLASHAQTLNQQQQQINGYPAYVTNAIRTALNWPCVVYYQGQITRTTLDIFQPGTSDHTLHDLIELHGYTNAGLCLRWMDYRVKSVGAVVAGKSYIAAGGTPRSMEIDGVTFLGGLIAFESDTDGGVAGAGHNIRILNSPYIATVEVFQVQGNGNNDRHFFGNCNIGRVIRQAAYFGAPGHVMHFDRCQFGRNLTSGSVFDYHGASDLRGRVTNSTIFLNEGVKLGLGDVPSPPDRLTFVNCSLVYPDGTTVPFDNSDEESGTVLRFLKDADYPAISSGTFTVDTTIVQPGVVVRVEVGVGGAAPAPLPAQFELIWGSHVAGTRVGYGFSVMPTGKIEYFIYPKPTL